MAKIYYNDNGTWKVVDIPGGGGGGSIDPTSTVTAYGFHATGAEGQAYLYPDNIQLWDTAGNQYMYSFPSKSGVVLIDTNVKTLFGNQSIVGTGNIDLYRHNIKFTATSPAGVIRFVIISSKNIKVDSLTDLKTLLGNTFEYPANGVMGGQGIRFYVTAVTETGYKYYVSDGAEESIVTTYPAGTWTDDVKTV